jgi:carbamate kinase
MGRIVLALGGNALLKRGETADIDTQRANARAAAAAIAPLADDHEIVITHGNGPQVGFLALQQAALPDDRKYPLDVLGAESEGLIGYLLELELRGLLPGRKPATFLTMVEIDPEDPAMARPAKPVGPVYNSGDWQALSAQFGWRGVADGDGMRRVVPSPLPRSILQAETLRDVLAAGGMPICAGGGGIPVFWDRENRLTGVEAVIDKDWTSARLAVEVDADLLVLLTDVDAVYENWGDANASPVPCLSAIDVNALPLPPGSMGPKADAAAWFAETTGNPAAIGALFDAAGVVAGRSGTRIV